jgi:hypothetical protein
MLKRLLLATALLAPSSLSLGGPAEAARHQALRHPDVRFIIAPLYGTTCGWKQVRVGNRYEWRRVC